MGLWLWDDRAVGPVSTPQSEWLAARRARLILRQRRVVIILAKPPRLARVAPVRGVDFSLRCGSAFLTRTSLPRIGYTSNRNALRTQGRNEGQGGGKCQTCVPGLAAPVGATWKSSPGCQPGVWHVGVRPPPPGVGRTSGPAGHGRCLLWPPLPGFGTLAGFSPRIGTRGSFRCRPCRGRRERPPDTAFVIFSLGSKHRWTNISVGPSCCEWRVVTARAAIKPLSS